MRRQCVPGEKGSRESGAGVLARNNVSCKRLMRILPLETRPHTGIAIGLSQSGRGRPRPTAHTQSRLTSFLSFCDYQDNQQNDACCSEGCDPDDTAEERWQCLQSTGPVPTDETLLQPRKGRGSRNDRATEGVVPRILYSWTTENIPAMISQPAIMNATIFPVDFSFFTLGRGSYSAEPVSRKRTLRMMREREARYNKRLVSLDPRLPFPPA